jgi:hypothetical protein
MARQPAALSLRAEPEQAKRVDALLDAFQSDMVEMNMACDAKMAALADSVRRDAGRLSGMTLAEYRRALPGRADRFRRLIAAQELMRQSGM